MRINIRQDLERPTHRGRMSIYKSIVCRKEEANDVVNRYIWDTINDTRLIRTVTFAVFFRDHKGHLVHKFEYNPTYPKQ